MRALKACCLICSGAIVVATSEGCSAGRGAALDPPTVAEVSVEAPTDTVLSGSSVQLAATARDIDGVPLKDQRFRWTSGDTSVALVSELGLVTGRLPGQVDIQAWVDGIGGRHAMTVSTPAPSMPGCERVLQVSTVVNLRLALGNLLPGDCVFLVPGTYTLTSGLSISRSGTAERPVTIRGKGWDATIIDVNAAPLTIDASHIHIEQLRLTGFGNTGLRIRNGHYNLLDSIEIDHADNEALAFKNLSTFNIIRNSRIHDTGIVHPQWGEGVYVGGSADAGYPTDFGVTDNQILDTYFGPNVRAQAVDVKGGSHRTVIRGNVIDGSGTQWLPESGSAALIDIIASDVIIEGNRLQYGSPDAIRFLAPSQGRLSGIVVRGNTIDLHNLHDAPPPFYGFHLTVNTTGEGQVTLGCDNIVTDGPFSNVACVP